MCVCVWQKRTKIYKTTLHLYHILHTLIFYMIACFHSLRKCCDPLYWFHDPLKGYNLQLKQCALYYLEPVVLDTVFWSSLWWEVLIFCIYAMLRVYHMIREKPGSHGWSDLCPKPSMPPLYLQDHHMAPSLVHYPTLILPFLVHHPSL